MNASKPDEIPLAEQLKNHAFTPDEGVVWAARARTLMAEAAELIWRLKAATGARPGDRAGGGP
jgi:hypothetical protein